MPSHVDCKASFRSFIAVFDCNVLAIDVLLRTRNSFLTHFFSGFLRPKMPRQKSLTKMQHPEVSQDTTSWIQSLKSLAWGLAWRGLEKQEACSLRDSQQNPEHMWHMLCEILNPSCLLVLYLSGRVFQKLHDFRSFCF